MKLSSIHEHLQTTFALAPIEFTIQETSHVVSQAFPNLLKKRMQLHGQKATHIIGLQRTCEQSQDTISPTEIGPSSSSGPVSSVRPSPVGPNVESQLEEEKARNQALTLRVKELEGRVKELEQQPQGAISLPLLSQQLDSLIHCGTHVMDGPDTPSHFEAFSLTLVMDEIESFAPEVFHLFMNLGNSGRYGQTQITNVKEKVAMSLCTLLNSRTNRAKGVQLMISLMLIARATSKQVGTTEKLLTLYIDCTTTIINFRQ